MIYNSNNDNDDDDDDDDNNYHNDDDDDDDDDDDHDHHHHHHHYYHHHHRIERRNLSFLQSPHCAVNYLQKAGSSGLGAIVCKSHATHHVLVMCNMSCHFV